jgi:hypothetical protein
MVPYAGRRGEACPNVPLLRLSGPRQRLIVDATAGGPAVSGARDLRTFGSVTGWLSHPCPAEAAGIESIGATVIPTRLVTTSSATGAARPPGAELFLLVAQRPRSRRRPLSATQHHPTTALVGISWHCKEPCKFMSSILTISVTTTHCIPITYKRIFISMTYENSKKIK